MAHLIETMAYANEVPWHGLGNNIDAESSIEEWQRQAGLDWTVSKRPVLFNAPDHRRMEFGGTPITPFKDKFVLARHSSQPGSPQWTEDSTIGCGRFQNRATSATDVHPSQAAKALTKGRDGRNLNSDSDPRFRSERRPAARR